MTEKLWQPSVSIQTLKARARFLQKIRSFFENRGYLEVETPILSRFGNNDPSIESFLIESSQFDSPLFLHTSPEFFMKRLLAMGSGPIYQVCKVFRQGELGRLHNPEFTMVEWYRPGISYQQLMDELDDFIRETTDFSASAKFTYYEIFQEFLGIDIFSSTLEELRELALSKGINPLPDLGDALDGWRDLLLSHFIEPELGSEQPVFIYDYPASQAALAVVRDGSVPVAERFELYIKGIEIANGYQELRDEIEHRRRFVSNQQQRADLDMQNIPYDENFLSAVRAGFEPVSGVALGFDRLFMLVNKNNKISEINSFSFERV